MICKAPSASEIMRENMEFLVSRGFLEVFSLFGLNKPKLPPERWANPTPTTTLLFYSTRRS